MAWEPDPDDMLGVQVTATGASRITLDYGDGSTTQQVDGGVPVVHRYPAAGTYTVTGSATGRSSGSAQVGVKDHAPKIHAFVSPEDDWQVLLERSRTPCPHHVPTRQECRICRL